MLFQMDADNNVQKWMLRVGGWLMVWLGLQMFLGPLAVLPDVVPCIGPMLGDKGAKRYVNWGKNAMLLLVRAWGDVPLTCGAAATWRSDVATAGAEGVSVRRCTSGSGCV